MRRMLLILAVPLLLAAASFADKPTFAPYGFVKGDMYYATAPVTSWGTPSLTCVSRAVHDTDGGMGLAFTAQHTRFGLKGSGEAGSVTMGGVVELDFFVIAANANARPRMRQAYAWCQPIERLDIRVGQQWDLFSPLNPTTNNTNANLWYNGNHGFRRPQFQLRYGLELGKVMPELQVSVGEAAKEDEGKGQWLGEDNRAELPMVQYRLGVNLPEKMALGFSGMYAAFGANKDVTSMGMAFDLNLPLHKLFAVKGELAWGRNLNNANLFTIGGSGSADNDVVTLGYWLNVVSKPLDFLHLVFGAAQERTIEGLLPGNGDTNLTLYGDLIVPIGEHFSLAAEYQWLQTSFAGQDEPYTAGVIDIAGKVAF